MPHPGNRGPQVEGKTDRHNKDHYSSHPSFLDSNGMTLSLPNYSVGLKPDMPPEGSESGNRISQEFKVSPVMTGLSTVSHKVDYIGKRSGSMGIKDG